MSVQGLLSALRRRNVHLRVDQHELRVDAPKGVLRPADIQQIRDYKSSIIDFLASAGVACSADVVCPEERPMRVPLSLSQERLWFIWKLGLAGAAYHIVTALRVRGTLSTRELRRALNAVLTRHESLRTVFDEIEGEASQLVCAAAEFELLETDLSASPPESREAALAEIIRIAAAQPFDLRTGPLIRGHLVRVSSSEHVMVLTMHHIVSDGWSTGIFLHELGAYYDSFCRGVELRLPSLPIQFADYAIWQRQLVAGNAARVDAEYWCRQLADCPALLELPRDRARPGAQSHRGGAVPVRIETRLRTALLNLARTHNATLFMVLYAGFAVLLSKLSRQRDIVIGIPVANRPRPDLEGLVGFFVNTLALRIRIDPMNTVRDLLAQVRTAALDAFAHQNLPFERVVELVRPPRSLSHSPIFQVTLTLQNTPQVQLDLPGLELRVEPTDRMAAQFDLALQLQESGSRIVGVLNYAADLFDAETVERWAGHLLHVLEQMSEGSNERSIQSLTLLTELERKRVLKDLNETRVRLSGPRFIHTLFEEQALRTPNEVAIVHDGIRLSYAELDARANRLAHYLRAHGIDAEQFVALCVDRSPEMVVGLLGILKAGGAYIPIDPGYPSERIAYILQDAAASVVVTERINAHRFDKSKRIVCLDDGAVVRSLAEQPETSPQIQLRSDGKTLAYVMYTSGSTGQPKGVLIEHAAVANFVAAMRATLDFGAADVVLATTSISFDIAGLELYLPLTAGAQVVIASSGTLENSTVLLRYLRSHPITVMQATPATWTALLDEDDFRPGPGFKALCGGDVLPESLMRRMVSRLRHFWHLYGPTETTIWSSVWLHSQDDQRVVIGRPIQNTRFYVVDDGGALCGIGIPGELWIGGDGVARGYLNRPHITASKFVVDPFQRETQEKVYRTGDLVRWTRDNTLEFLGREDRQVKLRGFRIELGEIEAHLNGSALVREAAAVVRENSAGEKILTAYIVPRECGPRPASQDFVKTLKQELAQSLPQHLIPTACIVLDALPLTSNGKIDRLALPALQDVRSQMSTFVAPGDAIEEKLAGIWQEVLSVRTVGVDDNFFELGGHSMSLARVVSKARQSGLAVTTRDLFEHQTIRSIASFLAQEDAQLRIERLGWRKVECLIKMNVSPSAANVFAVHPLGGLAFCYSAMAGELADCCNFYGLQHPSLFSDAQIHTIDDLVAHYRLLIQEIQPKGPYHLLGWSLGGELAYELACQLVASGQAVGYLGLFDSVPAGTDLEPAPIGLDFLQRTYAGQLNVAWEDLKTLSAEACVDVLAEEAMSGKWHIDGIDKISVRRHLLYLWRMTEARAAYRPSRAAFSLDLYRTKSRAIGPSAPTLATNDYGWGRLTSGDVRTFEFEAAHQNFILRPFLSELLGALRERLRSALSDE